MTLACRLCGAALRRSFVDLGAMPLAHAFVTPEDVESGLDKAYPLHIRVCDTCFLVQVDEIVSAGKRPAVASHTAPCASTQFDQTQRFTDSVIERLSLRADCLVMEVGSKDGSRLQHFQAAGIPVLGIESVASFAEAARRSGIPTETTCFNTETAMQIAANHGRADLVIANDVLGSVPDVFGFAAGFTAILRPNGVAIVEFPHLLRLIEDVRFDAICHERYAYLSLMVVEHVLRSVGLRVFDVERLPSHGGSLRVYGCHVRGPYAARPSIKAIRTLEVAAGLDQPEYYDGFASRVAHVQRGFRHFLAERKEIGRRLAAFGAAANGNTFLNSCGVTSRDIVCVGDNNADRQGRLLPGSHVPIVAPDALLQSPPDDLLILPWQRAGEIAAELTPLRDSGTEFWIACPSMQRV